jgi:pyruvate/2-oxoglutarate dehydrogenase complex dihydrolipoamide dehydrogenase (E3) component
LVLQNVDAKQKYNNVKSLTMQFASIGKAVVENNTRGFIKIIVDIDTNKILGITFRE